MNESMNQASAEAVEGLLEETIAETLETVIGLVRPVIADQLRFFRFRHLPPLLRAQSMHFAELACRIAISSSNVQTFFALQKLCETKDLAVRALL